MSTASTEAGQAVARAIGQLRRARGFTLRDLEERLAAAGQSINRDGINRAEHSHRKITVEELVAFAEIFQVAPASMLRTECDHCLNSPAAGFTCNQCGTVAPFRNTRFRGDEGMP